MNVRRATATTRQALAYLHDSRRSRGTVPKQDLPPRLRLPFGGGLLLRERVADRLADAMCAIFEALEMCESERAASWDAARLGAQIRAAYDQVNGLMKNISD
jgi:hypothetical protein